MSHKKNVSSAALQADPTLNPNVYKSSSLQTSTNTDTSFINTIQPFVQDSSFQREDPLKEIHIYFYFSPSSTLSVWKVLLPPRLSENNIVYAGREMTCGLTRRYLSQGDASSCPDRKLVCSTRGWMISTLLMCGCVGSLVPIHIFSSLWRLISSCLAADVKTDERAKMSVAAKMSLFKVSTRLCSSSVLKRDHCSCPDYFLLSVPSLPTNACC